MSKSASAKPAAETAAPQQQTIRLGDIVQKYLEAFQRAFDHLCFALPSFRTMSEQHYDEFARSVGMMPSGPNRMSFDKAKEGTEKWFLANSLKDLLSITVLFLEDARTISALVEYKAAGGNDQARLQKIMSEERQKFLGLPLTEKFKALKEQYNVTSPLEENVMDLLAMVNCIAQRQGVVGEADVNRNGKLSVKIRSMQMVPVSSGAQAPNSAPSFNVTTQFTEVERTFAVGEKISLSKQDHISTIMNLSILVTTMAASIQEFAKNKGVAE